jgi:endoglucanase
MNITLHRLRTLLPALGVVTCLAIPATALAQQQGPNDDPIVDPPATCGVGLLPDCPDLTPAPAPPAAPAPAPAPDPRGVDPNQANPLLNYRWYVDKVWTPQYKQYKHYLRRGEKYKASLVGKIALQPQFKWFGRWNENDKGGTAASIRGYLERAQEEMPGTVAQIVTLRGQSKGCGPRYSGGGAREDERTKKWYRDLARGIGSSRVVIGFEPDSLGTIDCLAKSRRKARLEVLKYAVDQLSALPAATVYLEAGASDWEPASRTAKQLRMIGIGKVRGFMLNVTHYDWTAENIKHGRDISRRVGGKPFIISTSFNGRGPVHYKRWISHKKHLWRRVTVWCHPLRRGLGIAPTAQTNQSKVDGYFYIGRPGFSGGSCNGGPLPVGSWYEKRALMFGRYATSWVRPPARSKFGFGRGLSLKSFAGDQLQR